MVDPRTTHSELTATWKPREEALVWSYKFTNYTNFKDRSNVVTPSPNWRTISPQTSVPISTTPPLSETDYNAVNVSLWKQLGKQVLVKSNINNWLVCHPGNGNLVDLKAGSVSCHFLDTAFSYTNKFNCSVFKKPGKLPTHWKPEAPTKWKRNCIIGALHGAKRICTDFEKDIKTLETSFFNAGSPKSFIMHTIHNFLNDSSQDDNIIPNFLFEERKKVFIKLPFCGRNEKLSKTFIAKLNKFTNFSFIFIMLWQTRQIKSLFNNKDKNTNRSKVVYKGDCSCGVDYIGETVRNLAVRIAEHSNLLIPLNLQNTCVKTHQFFSLARCLFGKNTP